MNHNRPPRPQYQHQPASHQPAPPPRMTHALPMNPMLQQQHQQPPPQPSYPPQQPLGNYSYGGIPQQQTGNLRNLGAMAAAAALGALHGGSGIAPVPHYNPQAHGAYMPQQQSFGGYTPYHPQANAQGYTLSPAAYAIPTAPPAPASFPPPASSHRPAPSTDVGHSSSQPPNNNAKRARLNPTATSHLPMRNCQLATCSFIGIYRDVEVHEMDRHLIFPPGYEQRPSKPDAEGPAVIEGTGISLQTPEQIAAWIAERKKRWPTKKRVEEKAKVREEAIARGELRPNSVRGGGRGGRGGGRGDFRGGSIRGGARGNSARGSDGGWKDKEAAAAASTSSTTKPGDDTVHDYDSDPLSSSSADSDSDGDSDSEGGSDVDPAKDAISSKGPPPLTEAADSRPPCSYFLTPKGCRMGDACRFAHDSSLLPKSTNPGSILPRALPRARAPPPVVTSTPVRPGSTRPNFLLNLLKTDIRHTISDLSQVVRFLCENNLLEGVEVRIGQAEEREVSGVKVIGEGQGEGDAAIADGEGPEEGNTPMIEEVVTL